MNVTGAILGACCIAGFNALLAALLAGVGMALRRAFGARASDLDDVFAAFWLGLGLVVTFAMLWNFAWPIGTACAAIVAVAGLAGLIWTREELRRALAGTALPRWWWPVALAFSLWVADLANGRMPNWDTSLYHMQAVEWARAHPVVPGLANLFGPLGFNNSIHLFDALLDVGPWEGRAWHVANSVLVAVFGVQVLASLARVQRDARPAARDVFALPLLAFAASAALTDALPSFSTALPSTLLLMVVAHRAVVLCTDEPRGDSARAFDIVTIALLSAIAVSIKLSTAVFATLAVGLSIVAVFTRVGRSGGWRAKTLVWTGAGLLLVGGSWSTRGVVLSGYPLFPSSALPFDVEWRAPSEHARAEFAFVALSARAAADQLEVASGESTGFAAWLPGWRRAATANPFDLIAPAALAVALALLFVFGRRESSRPNRSPGLAVLIAATLVCSASWFVVAPMPHYGTALFWILAGLLAALAASRGNPNARGTRRIVVASAVFALSPCLTVPVWRWAFTARDTDLLRALVHANLHAPEAGRWLHTSHPTPELEHYTTRSGLVLGVPTGDGARCWDAPIPCTPNPAPNLRLRVPGDLASGFVVDGEWRMEHWPERWRSELLPALRRRWAREAASD